MKKSLLLIAALFAFMIMSAQEPALLYKINGHVTNDESWNSEDYDYTTQFAFRGTDVVMEVYDDNSIIIRDWTGQKGLDLKLTYDPSVETDENCFGNVVEVSSIINGKAKKPYIYSYTPTGYDYEVSVCDVTTGRSDVYAIADFSYNEDGTLYYSYADIDEDSREGYISLCANFTNSEYSAFAPEYYYYIEWTTDDIVEVPAYYIYPTVTNDESWNSDDYDYTTQFAFRGTPVEVEVYNNNTVIIRNWTGQQGLDLKVGYDPSIEIDDECFGNVVEVNAIINGEPQKPYIFSYTPAGYDYEVSACDVTTGRSDIYAIADFSYNEDGTLYYCYADIDNEAREGYISLCANFTNSEYSAFAPEYYYYIEWGEELTGINGVEASAASKATPIYNLQGQRVGTSYKGIVIKNGQKQLQK